VPAAAGGERWGKVTPFLQRHSASGRMPESLIQNSGGYYWQFRKISQAFLRSPLQTSKERRGIRPCFAKLRNSESRT
jgi:hypothetical protein